MYIRAYIYIFTCDGTINISMIIDTSTDTTLCCLEGFWPNCMQSEVDESKLAGLLDL